MVKNGDELSAVLRSIKETFDCMDRFQFRLEELNLERGRRRLVAVDKVLSIRVADCARG